MDKATKTKIILFASLGIFVLVVLAVTLALTGKGDNREEDGSVNTSLRAQQQSGSDSLAGTVKAEPESRQSESGRSHETENGESPAEKGNAEEGRA